MLRIWPLWAGLLLGQAVSWPLNRADAPLWLHTVILIPTALAFAWLVSRFSGGTVRASLPVRRAAARRLRAAVAEHPGGVPLVNERANEWFVVQRPRTHARHFLLGPRRRMLHIMRLQGHPMRPPATWSGGDPVIGSIQISEYRIAGCRAVAVQGSVPAVVGFEGDVDEGAQKLKNPLPSILTAEERILLLRSGFRYTDPNRDVLEIAERLQDSVALTGPPRPGTDQTPLEDS